MGEYGYIRMRVRSSYFRRFKKTRATLRGLGIIIVIIFLWGLFSHSDSSSVIPNSFPHPGPSYCQSDQPYSNDSYTEGLIAENCSQDLGYRQSLYQTNQDYAAGGITTVPYPWCQPNQPCNPTPDMTTP